MTRRRGPSTRSVWRTAAATAAAALVLSTAALAAPLASRDIQQLWSATNGSADASFLTSRDDSKPFTLRLMPLGASITEGIQSSQGYGYRKPLRDQLRAAGWPVNMVGSKRQGGDSFVDQDNEGHPGWVIQQIADLLPRILWMKPNLVTINVGTNDCIQNKDVENAANRLAGVVDTLLDNIDGVTIIISTLLPNTNSDRAATNVGVVNAGYRNLAADRAAAGKRVVLAEMDNGYIPTDMLVDGIHPSDEGYKRMAAVWWDAIQKAEAAGMLQPPDARAMDDGQEALTTCDVGSVDGPAVLLEAGTVSGGGGDDGYKHAEDAFAALGISADGVVDGTGVFFAELVQSGKGRRDALDDMVHVDTDGKFGLWVNNGGGKFGERKDIDPGMACAADSVAFGDLNNDGLADIYCISSNGAISVSLNRGGDPPTFESVGEVHGSKGDYPPNRVRIADIDGDGRADYCVIEGGAGDIRCWRNGGVGDTPAYWQGFQSAGQDGTIVFAGIDGNPSEGAVLADLNGDFRDDWLWIGDSGEVWTYVNNRIDSAQSYAPDFVPVGQTHKALVAADARKGVKFGRIYGTGRMDYVQITSSKIQAKKNTGAGGVALAGDGVHFCDMRGSGRDDLVSISPNGDVRVLVNDGDAAWTDAGVVLETGRAARTLHVADWDGDGRCDVLSVSEADGSVELWRNEYDADKGALAFSHDADTPAADGASCAHAAGGVAPADRGVRLADIDGDGRADYLCIEPGSRATGFLNTPAGMEDVGQVKLSIDLDRANLRYVDVNADGLADLVWLDKFSGAVRVWANRGRVAASGSSFTWEEVGGGAQPYAGQDRGGQNVVLANVKGTRRADYVTVGARDAQMNVWWSRCDGRAVGDDETSLLPLPEYSS